MTKKTTTSIDELIPKMNKDYGAGSVGKGMSLPQVPRLPSGIFPFDLATGGGIPRNRLTICFGNESCLTGDTRINYHVRAEDGRVQNSKGGTIETLYRRFNDLDRRGSGAYRRKETARSWFSAPCVNDEGFVFHNRITNVVCTGLRECYRVRTSDGEIVEATEDHKFMVASGFRPLKELNVGDSVMMHDGTRVTGEGRRDSPSRPEVLVKHHPYAREKTVRDRARGYAYRYKRVPLARLCYEAHLNGLDPETMRDRLNRGELEGLRFVEPGLHIHHLDEDFTNNAPSNLVAMSPSDHGRLHASECLRNLSFIAVEKTIVSIEPVGVRETFDLRMADPFNNYVANGFVVHNSGKTNLALRLIRMHQRLFPKQTCVFVDIEGTQTEDWARAMGVDWDALAYARPGYAEQCVNMVGDFVSATDCGLLVIDSIAALATMGELEEDAEKQLYAGAARPVSRLVKRLTSILNDCAKRDDWNAVPTILWINQQRTAMGGNSRYPQLTFPGGDSQKFMASMRVRLYGKNIEDKDVSDTMPVRKYTKGVIQKWKSPIFGTSFEYEMAMVPHKGLAVGDCKDEWGMIKHFLDEHDLMKKVKGGYEYDGQLFAKQAEVREYLQVHENLAKLEGLLLATAVGKPMNSEEAKKIQKGIQ